MHVQGKSSANSPSLRLDIRIVPGVVKPRQLNRSDMV